MADNGARACVRGCYGTGTSKTRKGKQSGAHSEVGEKLGGLGGVLHAANRRYWWSEPEEEDDGGVGVAGRPGLRLLRGKLHGVEADGRVSTERHGVGYGCGGADSGDGRARATRERETEEEEEHRESEREGTGA